MTPPSGRQQDDAQLRAAAEAQLANAPMAEPLARPAEELLRGCLAELCGVRAMERRSHRRRHRGFPDRR